MSGDSLKGVDALFAAINAAKEHTPFDLKMARLMRSDLGNARRLIARNGKDLMFVREVGWYAWTGTHWCGKTGENRAMELAHQTGEAIYQEARALALEFTDERGPGNGQLPEPGDVKPDETKHVDAHRRWAVASTNTPKVRAMLEAAIPYCTVDPADLDQDNHLFNVENGTLELKNYEDVRLVPHNRDHRITRLAPVKYDPDATSKLFLDFIGRILPNENVRVFMQTYNGYSLTGDVGEEVMVLQHGKGANGKSTLTDAVEYLMGDYCQTIPFASLLRDDNRRGSEASPDIARLPGARLVLAAEPDHSVMFSEGMIKSMTGGDTMAARKLHKEFFEFKPQFKLLLSFNNKPMVRGQDEGIWRRLLFVPFEVQIPREERDRKLKHKLQGEASGILNWMLDGFRLWAEGGLTIPEEVQAATREYREDSDPLGQFISAAVEEKEGARTYAKDLYEAYEQWCLKNAVTPMKQGGFGRSLSERGFHKEKVGIYIYNNIHLKEQFKAKSGDATAKAAEDGPPADHPAAADVPVDDGDPMDLKDDPE